MNHDNVVTLEQAADEMRRLAKKVERRSSNSLEEMKEIQRDCQEKIQSLKYELSKDLIDKANEPVNRAVQVLTYVSIAVVMVGGAFAWLTASNLESSLQTLMVKRIESWLSLEDEHSQASRTLDAYRTQALLDSYMIQLARQKAQNRPITNLNFKISDKKRLMAIVRSPSSEYHDFLDALRLLALADGEWGIVYGDNELGRDFVGLIEDPRFDSNRKLDILQVLSRNRNLVDVEAAYLQNNSAPEPLRYQSYLNLKDSDKGSTTAELALKYAISLLESSDSYKIRIALEHIAGVDPFNTDLKAFVEKLSERDREARMDYRLAVARGLISQLPSPDVMSLYSVEDSEPVDRTAIRLNLASLFSDLLDDGLVLGLDKLFNSKAHLVMHYLQANGAAATSQFPLKRLLEDEQLIQAIYQRQYSKGLDRFVRFFSVTDRGEVVALAKLTVPASVLGVERDTSLPKNITGRLELTQDAKVKFTWRDNLGDWKSCGTDSLRDAKVNIVFDKDAISYRDENRMDWIF
ncbi:hypothetical protein [Pseudomonas sp. R16(2017)]|uniref:hypothetical protein n=1 Tax=Pseudomonas sp. R16(2017) TaxID=1981704 RepID=UPI000A1ED7F0|nr:hypothetical protein [Pseudomonas sp. R16(2017)]